MKFKFRRKLKQIFIKYKLFPYLIVLYWKSLFYNSDVNFFSIDTLLDPILGLIDRHMKHFGPIFVLIVFVILMCFIVIAYLVGVPYWYQQSPLVLTFASLIGHWLLVNVIWNYYKALYTLPGDPSNKPLVTEVVSFCKKCIAPKPPRCHHCSICKRCVLKMDHHCPWLNNCVGHYNHRYFYFFCAYTWLGTIFVMIFGVWIALDHLLPSLSPFEYNIYYDSTKSVCHWWNWICIITISHQLRHRLILFEAIITILLFILLGLLLRYHSILITNGETCIERHINRKCRKYIPNYRNPYDFGPKNNWRNFFGFDKTNRINSWLRILLPSTFEPIGDGFSWNTNNDHQIDLHCF